MPRTFFTHVAGLLAAAIACVAAGPGAPSVATAVRNTPRNNVVSHLLTADPASGWTSANWSGYAVNRGPYSQVSATWTVPTPQATPGPTYSSIWIGIDGFNNTSLIQVGTEQDYNGGTGYYAWWEILPSSQQRVGGLALTGGDQIAASIVRGGSGAWTITLADQTSGQSFSTTQSYGGPLSSAEWIMEAPNVGSRPADLAHYGQTSIAPVQVNGTSPGLTRADAGVMIQNGQQVSTPSDPNLAGDRFAIAYGSQAPPTPFF